MTRLIWTHIAICALLAAACSEGRQRSFSLPTAPSTLVPTPPPPAAPVPPAPPAYPPPAGPKYEPGTGQATRSGESTRFTIDNANAACYVEWDLTGRCRLFELTPTVDGHLELHVRRATPSGYDVIDVFVVPSVGDVVFAFDGWDWEQASLPAVAGRSYGIFVMAYPPFPQEFRLDVTLR
jgi:hypothetical protein